MWYEKYKHCKYDKNYQDNNLQIINLDYSYEDHYNEYHNNQNHHGNNYSKVFNSKTLSRLIKQFLNYIFDVVPREELYSIIKNVSNKIKINNADYEIFKLIKQKIIDNNLRGFMSLQYHASTYKLLLRQRDTLSTQIRNIFDSLGINYPLNGYCSIGDPGRYINVIKKCMNIQGPIYIMHDEPSKIPIIEQGNIPSSTKFIKLNYDKIDDIYETPKISTGSVDLITCFIGLHHFSFYQLDKFLKMVYKMLRFGGYFVIREHDSNNVIFPLIYCAHSIFNAVIGETNKNEKNEIRNFKPVGEWRKIIESYGFRDMFIYDIQKNDPTKNLMICFKKITASDGDIVIPRNIKKMLHKDKDKYYRDLSQTYHTLPEWLSVDIIKEYGNFLEHTPWYKYPYRQNISLYWSTFLKELKIISKKKGTLTTLCSSYVLMNIVIGFVITFMFLQLKLLSIVPNFIYSLPNNEETDKIRLVVFDKYHNIDNINIKDQIKILKQRNEYIYLELPRYKKFTNILLQLILNDIDIIEIAGQKEIQIKIYIDKNNKILLDKIKKVKWNDKMNYLFMYEILPNSNYHQIALSLQIDKMSNTIKYLIKNGAYIDHIYDF